MTTSIALFTRDLRVHDNPVLHAAAHDGDAVVPLFVLDEAILAGDYNAPNRARFLVDSLVDLDRSLRDRGARLVVRRGDWLAEVCSVAQEVGADVVHLAADVSAFAQRRADALRAELSAQGRELRSHSASITAVPPGAITPTGKDHFAVFTPYFRKWSDAPAREILTPPNRITMPDLPVPDLPTASAVHRGATSPKLAAGGEAPGRARLTAWLRRPINDYTARHDDLAADETSRLSPYLHFGCLSAIEIRHQVEGHARTLAANRGDSTETDTSGESIDSAGAEDFLRQLAWRDFHHQVLAARPAAAHRDYRTKHDHWLNDTDAVAAWKAGQTGYPIVDAGMRQLTEEGWMHNRARLITASFLAKTLYVDWRVGARYFLDWLVDGDIANNQLNWQWVAGTGTDSRPNRVLNPLAQAQRYDPDGEYVRRYLPELRDIPDGRVHEPWRLSRSDRGVLDYPEPIVDLQEAAHRFRVARGKE